MKFNVNHTLLRSRAKLIMEQFEDIAQGFLIEEAEQAPLRKRIRDAVKNDSSKLSIFERGVMLQYLIDEMFGCGPLGPALRNPGVREIHVLADLKILSFTENGTSEEDIGFDDHEHLMVILKRLIHPRKISKSDSEITHVCPNGTQIKFQRSPKHPETSLVSIELVRH
ncbi:MAG: hypothetical protein K8F91_24415 [Candidatus Obscuribacterales bacterium]|nr:hypothetical protein [Candidatus Obscuribacterales bacterium]